MAKRIKRSAAALMATSALFAGACSAGGSSAEFGPNSPELTYAFEQAKAYWGEQHENVGSIALKTITGGEVRCAVGASYRKGIRADSVSPATYCSDKDTVYISSERYAEKQAEAQAKGAGPEAVAAVTAAHEIGHHLMASTDIKIEGTNEELAADCLAAVAVKATQPDLIDEATLFVGELGGGRHGASAQRLDAFNTGLTMGRVGCDSIMLGVYPSQSS